MAYQSLRDWISKLEEEGLLRRIKTEVNWNLELGAITRRVADKEGPPLLFENIKDYHSTNYRKLFACGLASRERLALVWNYLRKQVIEE